MEKKVIIIGAGGHAAELDEYIQIINHKGEEPEIEVLGLIDDNSENYDRYSFSAPLLGEIKKHKVRTDCYYLMGIANLEYRAMFVWSFLEQGAKFMSLIHPTAYVSPSATIAEGVVIGPNVNVGPNVKVGEYTLLNSRCSIGHDTVIGTCNFICPNVCFSGFTTIGDGNMFGINSATLPGITIGSDNKIAAGMVVDKNIKDNAVVFHRFKEKVMAVPK
ncbi:acetyltransferase [Puteibacter caeruleilacunae]|nr:acetyltransferase [Puteibacter caeruleilacunae]